MTRDDIVRMAREAGLTRKYRETDLDVVAHSFTQIERFAALVAAAEREECAKMIETTDLGALSADPKFQNWTASLLFSYAAAIRARGQHD